MRHRAFWLVAAAITLVLSPLALARPAGASKASKDQGSSQPPNLSGVWFVRGKVRANFVFQDSSPLLPWGVDRLKANQLFSSWRTASVDDAKSVRNHFAARAGADLLRI
jgi:hypothetical protein